jgi:pimeloyl-ACP methyl ester carboxylesterase
MAASDSSSRRPPGKVRIQAGVELVGESFGNPDDPLVLLLHGGGQTRHAWRDTQQTLADARMYAIALDLRGHGESAWSEEGAYKLDAFVDDVERVIRTLGRPAALVGASLGGLTSLLVAGERDPSLVWALVLVDVAPRIEVEGRQRIMDFLLARPDGFASVEEAADEVERYALHRPRPRDPQGLMKNLRLGEDGRYRWHWDPKLFRGPWPLDTTDEPRLEAAATRVQVETLLVRGALSDVLSPEGENRFLELVPHAVVADVAAAGHMVAGDNNAQFTGGVVDFLSEALRRRRSQKGGSSVDSLPVPPS